ncbi:hypothetical protein BGZ83_010069 [Gryganskiella cystojenkinii]|nr:hypothetical protein BGZ83_010069 [Gryganskiella cystojenkinii]
MNPSASTASPRDNSTQMPMSAFYRRKLEQHQLNPEEWSAVRFAIIKHTLIAAVTTVTLGTSAFFFGDVVIDEANPIIDSTPSAAARSRNWSKMQSLSFATAGNLVGLATGGVIAMESGMKTVETRLQGSGSELLYLMDRYS